MIKNKIISMKKIEEFYFRQQKINEYFEIDNYSKMPIKAGIYFLELTMENKQ